MHYEMQFQDNETLVSWRFRNADIRTQALRKVELSRLATGHSTTASWRLNQRAVIPPAGRELQ
jgi:hypothetical protein